MLPSYFGSSKTMYIHQSVFVGIPWTKYFVVIQIMLTTHFKIQGINITPRCYQQ